MKVKSHKPETVETQQHERNGDMKLELQPTTLRVRKDFMNWLQITKLLKEMTYRDKLYKLVKAEMKRRGNWRPAPRGKAFVKGNLVQSTGHRLEQSKEKK